MVNCEDRRVKFTQNYFLQENEYEGASLKIKSQFLVNSNSKKLEVYGEFSREHGGKKNGMLGSKIVSSGQHSISRMIQKQKVIVSITEVWHLEIQQACVRNQKQSISVFNLICCVEFYTLFLGSISQAYAVDKFWIIGKILWDAKRNEVCHRPCPLPRDWFALSVLSADVLLTWLLLSQKFQISYSASKQSKCFVKNHENIASCKKFNNF